MFKNAPSSPIKKSANLFPSRGVRLAALATAGALALSLAGFASSAQAATPSVTFKGHVYSGTHKGVANVKVTVYYRTPSVGEYFTKSTKTSSTGRYEFKVPKTWDNYKIKVTDPGDNDRDTADGKWAPTLLPTFQSSASTVKKNVTVYLGGKLSGRIYDRTGKPVKAGLVVHAGGPGQVGSPTTYTRSDGAYYFSNLNAGPVTILADSPTTNGAARWYQRSSSSGTLNGEEASYRAVESGKKTTGMSIYFPTVSKITGRVLVDGAEPFGEAGNYVSTVLYDSEGKRLVDGYFTNPTFYFRDLPAGTYYLGFETASGGVPIDAEFYSGKDTLATATPIKVSSGGAVTGIVASLNSAQPAAGS